MTISSLDIKAGLIVQELALAITRSRKEINRIQESKDNKLKTISNLLKKTIADWKSFEITYEIPVEEAVKTMRKLPVFGIN